MWPRERGRCTGAARPDHWQWTAEISLCYNCPAGPRSASIDPSSRQRRRNKLSAARCHLLGKPDPN